MSHIDVLADDAVRNLVMPIPVELYHAFSVAGAIAEKTELIETLYGVLNLQDLFLA